MFRKLLKEWMHREPRGLTAFEERTLYQFADHLDQLDSIKIDFTFERNGIATAETAPFLPHEYDETNHCVHCGERWEEAVLVSCPKRRGSSPNG